MDNKLDKVRSILKTDKYKVSSLADKQKLFDDIISTKEVTSQELTSLIDEANIERMRKDREEERLQELKRFNTMSYDSFLEVIKEGDVSGYELLFLCSNFNNLKAYCDKIYVDPKTKEIYPYYVYYIALQRDYKIDLPPRRDAKHIYITLFQKHIPGYKANISKNGRFMLSIVGRKELECEKYDMSILKYFLSEIEIDLPVEIIITNDHNITLVKLEEVYENGQFVYQSTDLIRLKSLNSNSKIIYRNVMVYKFIFPEILEWIDKSLVLPNFKKLKNDSLVILRDYILNSNSHDEMERFEIVWNTHKAYFCDLLFLLFKIGKIPKK